MFGRKSTVDELLTRRESEVLELLAGDRSTAEIAQLLSIEEVTVRTHISSVSAQVSVANRQAALRRYRQRHS